jgi:hydroxymethylbilane synthase
MRLEAAWGDPEAASPLVRAQQQSPVRDFSEAEALGEQVAAMLRAGGAVWASNAIT